jgi:hypothetical protein
VVSSPLVDKLRVYAGLDVPEVWMWREGVIHVFVLEGDEYCESERSRLTPDLDLTYALAAGSQL